MKLTEHQTSFVLHWGEMGSRWGVNRTVAQIHALLFIAARPMHAEEIAETLTVARSNVSNSLKELQGLNLIRLMHVMGDRRDHFETSGDVWELLRAIAKSRIQREIEPTLQMLRGLHSAPGFEKEPEEFRRRSADALQLIETLTAWSDEMLRLSPDRMKKILKAGASMQRWLRGKGDEDRKGKSDSPA